MPVAITGSPDRLQPPLAALEDAQLADALLGEPRDGRLVLEADVRRVMRVAVEGDRAAGVEAHGEERRRRVALADRLSQAGGRHPAPDAGLRGPPPRPP